MMSAPPQARSWNALGFSIGQERDPSKRLYWPETFDKIRAAHQITTIIDVNS
jgi:hypothetical protein